MLLRLFAFLIVIAACLAAVPSMRVTSSPVDRVVETATVHHSWTASEFDTLCRTNPVAALEASLARFRHTVRGYRCTMQKQECLNGTLGDVEIITHAVREEPFAVFMQWEKGGGSAKATLYVRGENGGKMKVKTRFFLITDTDPNGPLPRRSSRFSIEDAGILNGTRRTHKAWKAARDAGRLQVEYLGRKAIPELGPRECHVLTRTCSPQEVDNFRMADSGVRTPVNFPKEAIATVTIYLDIDSGIQLGSEVRQTDGTLLGSYYFRDITWNPAFSPDQFTPSILR